MHSLIIGPMSDSGLSTGNRFMEELISLIFCVEVSLLTYLLTKEELTPEEVNGQAIEVISAGVDSVSDLIWHKGYMG